MRFLVKTVVVAILTLEARILLRRMRPKIVAITGSVGKTSTKDMVYAAIKGSVRARKSEKSYNSELGVPLTVLGLQNAWNDPLSWLKNIIDGGMVALTARDYPDVLVLEMGVDRPGDMERFTRWIQPDIVVLTRLPDVPVHVEFFESPEAVTTEKLKLVAALKSDGVFVFNHDDEAVHRVAETLRQQSVGYSRYSQSDFSATQDVIRYTDDVPAGLSFTLSHNHSAVTVELDGCVGVHHTYSAAAAAAVASQFQISLETVVAALKDYVPPPGRMRLIAGIKHSIIIDDSYNASPTATERALMTLKEIRCNARKIAVLGDMLELGRYSVEAHKRVGVDVASAADLLFTVGVRSQKTAESALQNGMHEAKIFQYDDAQSAARELQNMLQKGDVVLVKGSQSIRLEKLIEEIMAEPDKAEELLVRQSRAWKTRP